MQVTETEAQGLKRELKVVVPADQLGQKLDERLADLQSKVSIKGFRPGKVPVAHIRRIYGRSVMAEVVRDTVNEATQKAMSERKERPAMEPEIDFPEEQAEIERVIAGQADLAFTMKFEVLPQFTVTDLAKLELVRPVAPVTDQAISDTLNRLAESNVAYEAKNGAAELKDRVTISFIGTIDGEAFEGGSAEDVELVLGSNQFIPGFEEGLLGVKADESREIAVTFPETYPAAHLAGKAAAFATTVKEVAAPQAPAIDDAFAKSMGLDSLSALKEAISARIKADLDKASRAKLKRAVLDALDEKHSFDLPAGLVDNEFNGIWQTLSAELARQNKTFADEDTTEDEARAKYRTIAERRVRLGLVIAEIGRDNTISVTQDEIKKALVEQVRQFPGQEKMVYEYYEKNPQAVASLRGPIFEDKVVDFISELAKVTDKEMTAEELLKPDDSED